MLSASIAITALSDLTAVGQDGTVPEAASGFQALLDAGSGNDIFSNNPQSANDGNQAANNAPDTPVSMPTSIFAANNTQDVNSPGAPTPPSPPQPQAPENTPSSANSQADNNGTNNNANANANNQAQNTPAPQSPTQPSSTPSNSGNQNAPSSTSGQSSAPQTQVQSSGGNTTHAGKQLRTQIQNQLGDISQILLSMIQALSVTPAQQVQSSTTVAAGTTPSSQVPAAGNNANDPTGGAQSGQEISLLKDMQSLLQQLQQSLGQGGNNQDDIQTLSDSLLSDMNQFSQMVNAPSASNSNNASSSLSLSQLQSLGSLLKTSIGQTQGQLQILQASNDALYAQFRNTVQQAPAEITGQSKPTQNNSGASVNTALATTGNIPAPAAVTPNISTTSPNNTSFNAPVVQASVSQGGSNGAGGNNQDSSQDQFTQPVITGTSSASSPSGSAGGTSFAKVLNQVSQGDVLNQVQVQVKTALSDGSSKITIQLNPPELGKVDVKLDVGADGKTSGVTITATNQGTLDLLQRDTQGLTRALNDAGLTTDSGSLNFSLSSGQQNQTQAGSQQATTTYQQTQPEDEDPATTINTISRNYVVNLADGLDITI